MQDETEVAKTPSILSGLCVSFGVHAAIVLAVVIGTITGSEAIEKEVEEKMVPFTPVELVRLGEKKPPKQLPRISNPAPKTIQEDVVNLAKKPKPEDVVLKKEKPKDKKAKRVRKKNTDDILNTFHNPNRPVNTDKPEGDPDGVPEGTVVDSALKHLMNSYLAKVQQTIVRNWRVPQTISQSKAEKLAGKVRVKVRVSPEGHIVSYRITRKSGDSIFDASVEETVRKFTAGGGGRRLPMPAKDDLKQAVVAKGLSLNRWKPSFR